jgi:hypothetical protein
VIGFRRPEPVAELTADAILRRVGASHDTRGRFTGRKEARPMCSRDDDPSQHDVPRAQRAAHPAQGAPAHVSPWVQRALADELPGPGGDGRRRESLTDTVRRTLPPVGPVAFEPRPIHPEDECPDPAECLAVHTL